MTAHLIAELRHRIGRALGTLTGVALGVALYIALIAAGDAFREAARAPLAGIGADILISRPTTQSGATAQTTRGVRQPFGLATLTLAEANSLGNLDGVGAVSGGLLLWDFAAASYQTLLGIDLLVEGVGPMQVKDWIVSGRFFEPDEGDVALVDRHYAAFYGLKPGAPISIGGREFNLVGVVDVPGGNSASSANFYLPLADAQSLANLPADEINQIYLRVDEATSVENVVTESETRLGEISALTEQSIVQVMGGIAQVSDRFAGVAALVALLGGLLLTGVTLDAGIQLRAREIGVMKAIGWQTRDVVKLFLTEGIALSLLGVLLGILLGWLSTLILGQMAIYMTLLAGTTPDFGAGPETSPATLPAQLPLNAVLIASASAIISGGLASWFSARRAAQLKPADALRE
ncbi:MAG: ABC transporter permease [Anaerolineae bacterium]|nr:ABC transporter permease [Anaerolineae bacterium]MBT4308840.1 ABC transporter permease [Anaerolineae bacterium]MBT4456998.1 ABC transporter permease [Anaerolineae bacterium]MBT4841516.1 ABC transporter permease [Anaerolineae bacterium]MBT6321749.1 ABC transporter permease [Anaerolineae bacterium]